MGINVNETVKQSMISIALIIALCFPTYGVANESVTNNNNPTPNLSNDNKNERYSPIFFSDYAPQTAYDMVQYLPGFVLVEEDNDVRGFSSGAGNILIDGTRPITKSGGIKEALERIPRTQVAFIEILRGNAGSSDTAGQSVVANVIRVKQSNAKQWKMGISSNGEGKLSPLGEFTISKQIGHWETAFKLDAIKEHGQRNAKIITRTIGKEQLKIHNEKRPTALNEIFISSDANTDINNHKIKVNARAGWSQYLPDTIRVGHYDNTTDNVTQNSFFKNERDSQYYTGELGLDWLIPSNNNWQWRLLNLNNIRNWFVDATTRNDLPRGNFKSGSLFRFDENTSENILRTTLSRQSAVNNGAFFQLTRQEYGLELAYSKMQSWLKLWSTNEHHQKQKINRDTYSKVNELRSESFINLTWQLPNLTLETRVAAEHSKISVSGDSHQSQSLFFIKPSIALVYDKNVNTQYRLNVKRTVGQLNFSDFAASADLVDDRNFSGNPTLKPDTAIYAGLAFDFLFSRKGAVGVELYHEWRSDVLEKIVLPSGGQALGNAGDAKVQGIKVSANLPLNRVLDDALLTFKANFIQSTFNDPVTGLSRELTDQDNPVIQIDFRQDIIEHNVSWGFGYNFYQENEEYYVNEYIHSRTAGRWNAFIETTRFGEFKFRLVAKHLGDDQQQRNRSVFNGNRSNSLITQENSKRTENARFNLTVSHAF